LTDVVGVPAIVGPAASGDTQEVFLDVAARGVLVISPSATSPALTALDPVEVSDDSPGLLWRTAASDALQGAVIAADMLEPGAGRLAPVTSVAAIHEVGAYGDGLYEVFARAFEEGGGTVQEIAYDGEGQLTDAIADGQASGADEILFISSQAADIINFLGGAASLPGYDDKGIFLTDAAANPDVLANANPARMGQVRATRPAPLSEADDVVYASFIAAYSSEFDEDVRSFSFAANAYDAAWLVVYGAAWALFQEGGEVTGATIARGLRRVSSGDAVDLRPSDWVSVSDAFREGVSVDASGASGALDYDPATEETAADIQVWRIQDREAVGIYKVSP
jgi:branched-chain amino acid transport system substrate-binding protein